MAVKTKKKRHKKSHPVADYIFYLAVRLLAVFIQLVEVNTSLRMARWLGRGLYAIYSRGRQRALENLRHSFPEKDPAWHERTARRSFEHLVMFVFDVLYVPRLVRQSNWRHCIKLGDISQVVRLLLNGRPVIMVGAHYGNFLICSCAMDIFGVHTFNIARPIDNPYLSRYVYGKLLRGDTIIYKKGATQLMDRVLTNGNILGVVGDQNGSRKDIFVDFFGRKAATYKSIALMAMQYDAPIVVGCARRIGDSFRFELDTSCVITPDEWRDRSDPLYWITAQWTAALEQLVRQDPEQYWWIHRRWKTRPPDERKANPLPSTTLHSPGR